MVNTPGTSFWNSTELVYDLPPMFGQIRGVRDGMFAEWETDGNGNQSGLGPHLGEDGAKASQMAMSLDGGCRANFQSATFGIFLNPGAYRSCSFTGQSNALGADDCLQPIEFQAFGPGNGIAQCRWGTIAWLPYDQATPSATATPA